MAKATPLHGVSPNKQALCRVPSSSAIIRLLLLLTVSFVVYGCGSGTTTSPLPEPTANPVPSVTSISPLTAAPGTSDFTLTVNGSNFVSASVVTWNHVNRPTTFVSNSQLTTHISASDVTTAGTVVIAVSTPAPGGGNSSPWIFSIEPDHANLWQMTELVFSAQASYTNPFTDNTLTCVFTGPNGESLTLSGFYDGNSVWRVRFAATATGNWTYRTTSANSQDSGLHGITGNLNVTAAASDNPLHIHGGFLRVSGNGHYLTYTDGTPFFWLGDTWWFAPSSLLPIDGAAPNFRTLVDKRKQQNFSVVQMMAQGPEWDSLIATVQTHQFDVAYWQNFDRYIAYANDNGLLPVLGFNWSAQFQSATLDDWKNLWTYVIARYGAYAVSWLICGEYNQYNVSDRVQMALALGKFIKANDPYKRAMSVHPWWYGEDQHQAWTESWYDFAMIQGGHLAPPTLPPANVYQTAYNVSPPKPLLEAECDYEGIYGGKPNEISPDQLRRVAYHAIQLGSFGYTYGSHGLWYPTQSVDDQTTWSDWGISPPWWEAMNRVGAAQMQILRNLYESLEWWKLEPRTNAVIPLGTVPDEPWVPRAKSIADDLYIVWFPFDLDSSSQFQLQLQTPVQQTFDAKWFDPQTGTTTPLSIQVACSAGLCPLPNRPDNRDWVLVLTKH